MRLVRSTRTMDKRFRLVKKVQKMDSMLVSRRVLLRSWFKSHLREWNYSVNSVLHSTEPGIYSGSYTTVTKENSRYRNRNVQICWNGDSRLDVLLDVVLLIISFDGPGNTLVN